MSHPSTLGLEGRSAVITGGSEGIGRAIALRLGQEGMELHLAARSHARLLEAQKEIQAVSKAAVHIYSLDLSTNEGQDRLFQGCPHADVLVNNAGAIPGGTLSEIDDATWRNAWDLKVFGYINLSRHFYDVMRSRKSGVIVNIIGNSGQRPRADNIAGCVGNAALTAFTQALGGRSLHDGIRVLGISPGPTATRRVLSRERNAAHSPEARSFGSLPNGALSAPEEIGEMTAFLISDKCTSVTGSIITVDMGTTYSGSFYA
ncbi:MAG: short-chain dehydrogenase/reductase [Bauldia litoralis]